MNSRTLEPYLIEAMKRQKPNRNNLLFFNRCSGEPFLTSRVSAYFSRICKRAGIEPRGQHALRHTFATRCIEAGVQPVVLKKWLGHSDIHITLDTYTDVHSDMLLTMCGLLVVIIGLMMWGVPVLRRISPQLTKPCRFRSGPAILGLLTGLMPCGALTVMWMFAAASGSWRSGAASMFAFGLGTCVLMITFGMFGKFIPKRYNKYITRVSTVLIVTLGLLLMTKGLKLL